MISIHNTQLPADYSFRFYLYLNFKQNVYGIERRSTIWVGGTLLYTYTFIQLIFTLF